LKDSKGLCQWLCSFVGVFSLNIDSVTSSGKQKGHLALSHKLPRMSLPC